MLQEGNNAWGPARVYVHGNRIDEIVWSYNTFTGEQAFHHYDARGHCTLLTDSVGGILEQYEYDAFGQPYFYDASGNSIGFYGQQGLWQGYSLFGNRFLFTGREWLSDVKLYDYRNRMYQPELGRFLQPDPKEFGAGDYNLYRYCHNDPVNRVDPDGTIDIWAMEMLRQGGGDGTTSEQAERMQAAMQQQREALTKPHEVQEKARSTTDSGGKSLGQRINEYVKSREFKMAVEVSLPAGRGASIFKGLSGLIAKLFGRSAPAVVAVTHFTNAEGAAAIAESGTIKAGSFVTTSNMSGLNATKVESILEISAGKGEFSTSFLTPATNLRPAYNGPLTSGGASQFQLINPETAGPFVPTP